MFFNLHVKLNILKPFILCFLIIAELFGRAYAQDTTIVRGTIFDAKTHEALPAVSVSFQGSSVGTSADLRGNYIVKSTKNPVSIRFSLVGYKPLIKNIEAGKTQTINVFMVSDSRVLNNVVIRSAKKSKYRNKGNPAVELIRQVIAHKKENRLEGYEYAEYQQYAKLSFYLSNLSDQFLKKKVFKNYRFLFREQDSTEIGGKNLLPLYMEEKLSDNYFRRSPFGKKELITANKQVQYDDKFFDNSGMQSIFNRMYQDIDVYDNTISLLGNEMLSPIADSGPAYYKYFIADTIKDVSPNLVELAFTPRQKEDLAFEGSIFITLDGHYAVAKAVFGVNKEINVNFMRKMKVDLSFDKDSTGLYHLAKSDLKMEFGINKEKGGGMFGERTVTIFNFKTGIKRPDQTYAGKSVEVQANAETQADELLKKERQDTLKRIEKDIYKDVDSLQTIPSFKRTMKLVTLFLAGYYDFGPFDMGPTSTFYNFNPIEGFRLRFGGRSTTEFSKRFYYETYGAYGFRDQKFKYFLSTTYSINDKSIYTFPQEYVRASFQHDTKIPGQELQFVQEDNFFLSFKHGQNTTWLYNDQFKIDYVHEYLNHFSYKFEFMNWQQHPAGTLYYENVIDGKPNIITGLRTTELSTELRYAPDEKFYQGKLYRTPLPAKYPIFTIRYQQGIKGLFGGAYNYENITGNVTKRFYFGQYGYADFSAEGGYLFGQVPYPVLDIHHANQTYALQLQSYNLMNFLEFVSDHYAAVNIDQNFNGYIFNKIPLIKKLKWREALNFKLLWGGVRAENNPQLHPQLYQFNRNADGTPTTYTLNNGPYMEASIGISNIFKLLRLDYVERFRYLDHPYVAKHGIRALIILQF